MNRSLASAYSAGRKVLWSSDRERFSRWNRSLMKLLATRKKSRRNSGRRSSTLIPNRRALLVKYAKLLNGMKFRIWFTATKVHQISKKEAWGKDSHKIAKYLNFQLNNLFVLWFLRYQTFSLRSTISETRKKTIWIQLTNLKKSSLRHLELQKPHKFNQWKKSNKITKSNSEIIKLKQGFSKIRSTTLTTWF